MYARITRMSYCLPQARLTNEDLLERFEPGKLRSILKMAGIEERRVVTGGVTAVDLATQAAEDLILSGAVQRNEIDLLIFTSQTADYKIPASACVLHKRLKLNNECAAFDINLGCSGFPYSLSVAKSMIMSGAASKALLLNADALTTVIHPQDRALVPLHGDGAAATLVEKSEVDGIPGIRLGTDGTGADYLIIPAGGARKPSCAETRVELRDDSGSLRTEEHLKMNGPAVFHFAVYKIPEIVQSALSQWGLTMDSIDLVILHQANKMMLDQVYRSLDVPTDKRFYYMESVGNLSGASTPVTLAEAWRCGKIQPGSRTLLVSFGVGLSWGVVLLEWPQVLPSYPEQPTDYRAQSSNDIESISAPNC